MVGEETMTPQQKLSLEFPGPKSVCICGHTGDGPNSEHGRSYGDATDILTVESLAKMTDGTGACEHQSCRPCDRFRWAKFTPEFQEALDKLKQPE